jgi:nucleoside phosphorylase
MDIILATGTIQYDSQDRRPGMGYMIAVDPSWLNLGAVRDDLHRGTIATADRDLTFSELESLRLQGVLGADWESAAISPVCSLNDVRWAVLRGISDVPHQPGPEDAARQIADYTQNTPVIMERLLKLLPAILETTL